jgi:beta-phosphoglucomutase family hydrolase
VLGLPHHITACLFDLDGVLTPTAEVHNAAWAKMFDEFLEARERDHAEPLHEWADRTSSPFVPFDSDRDYREYVDGRPRYDGVRTFLASRGIVLPEGTPDDPPEAQTVHGLGNRKNALVLTLLREQGVKPYPGSVAYLHAARAAGLRRAVVSASANCAEVLAAAGIAELIEVAVDGVVAAAEGLRGKPHPDTFLAAARRLDTDPAQASVFEDALAGVQAGRAGAFGIVVGVDRVDRNDRNDHAEALRDHGADIVVRDLADLLDRDRP